jgi:hypothetical protein
LSFIDEVEGHVDLNEESLLNDAGRLSQMMQAPPRWREIDERGGSPLDMECVKLLWELPMALHKQGVTISQLDLMRCIPLYTNFSKLRPPGEATDAWSEVSAAFEKLEFFHLDISTPLMQHRPTLVPDEDKFHLDHYVGAILSNCGKQLRYLHVDLSNLGMWTQAIRAEHENCYHAGPFLTRLQEMPRIRSLSLNCIDFQGTELDELLRKLGDEVEGIYLYNVKLDNGSWADCIDVFRRKLAAGVPHRKREAMLMKLYGSELGMWRWNEEASLSQDVAHYMRGELEHNPLRPGTIDAVGSGIYHTFH